MFVLNAIIKQHLGVNFGGIWRFEQLNLVSLSAFFGVFMLKKSGLIFKTPVDTVSPTSDIGSFIMSMAS